MKKLQALVHATQEQLDHIRDHHGIAYEICQAFDNGITIYEDSGDTILQRYAEFRRIPDSATPTWDSLDHDVQEGLMAMAAESPHWASEGGLDEYRVQQFEAIHGDTFQTRATT